jgi:hypothetical protein
MQFLNIKLDKSNKFEITPEGYIKTKAYLTRVGVFDYYEGQSKVRNLRPKEEVFSPESLRSLELKPLTFNHPDELVKNDNFNNYVVGTIGQDVRGVETEKGSFVEATVLITHKDAVEYVMKKHDIGESIELSCGYQVEEDKRQGIDPVEGKYDVIQRNIRYNHVSIVPEGRAGKEVKLLLDNANNNGESEMTKKEIKEEIKAEIKEDVKLDALQKELSALKEDAKKKEDEFTAKLDALEVENKKLNDELAKWQNPESEEVKAMLDAKQAVIEIAKKFDINCEGKSTEELKLECIKKTDESFNAEGKSEDYINARFDACNIFLELKKDAKLNVELAMVQPKTDACKEKKEKKKDLEEYSKEKRNVKK